MLSKEQIESKVCISLQLAPKTTYYFFLYGFAHKGDEDSFFKQRIGETQATTLNGSKAILCFYAHYVEDWSDEDAGHDPNYYWDFSTTNSKMNFPGCNLTRELTRDFDVDDEGEAKYCTLAGSKGFYDYKSKPMKFGSGTRKIMCEFDRYEKNNDFTVTWTCKEKDAGYDDTLGTVTAKFTYDKYNDTWTCEWQEGNGALPWSKVHQANKSTIGAGEHTNFGNITDWSWGWWLYNTSCGAVVLHWDWSWDYETEESMKNNPDK